MDLREDLTLQFQQIIEPLLISSLGDRISEMCFKVFQKSVGIMTTGEPFTNLLIGLKLNSQKANVVVERGPTANLPEVVICVLFIYTLIIKINYPCCRLKNFVHFGKINLN